MRSHGLSSNESSDQFRNTDPLQKQQRQAALCVCYLSAHAAPRSGHRPPCSAEAAAAFRRTEARNLARQTRRTDPDGKQESGPSGGVRAHRRPMGQGPPREGAAARAELRPERAARLGREECARSSSRPLFSGHWDVGCRLLSTFHLCLIFLHCACYFNGGPSGQQCRPLRAASGCRGAASRLLPVYLGPLPGMWHRLWPRGLCGLVLFLLRSQFTLQELLCLKHQNGLFSAR